MELCASCVYQPVCDNCEMSLKGKRNILYKFQGCGKYHNIKMCNLCFYQRFGYTLDEDTDYSNDKNDDPLGMKIIIIKRLKTT